MGREWRWEVQKPWGESLNKKKKRYVETPLDRHFLLQAHAPGKGHFGNRLFQEGNTHADVAKKKKVNEMGEKGNQFTKEIPARARKSVRCMLRGGGL